MKNGAASILHHRESFCAGQLFVDGLSRSGKMLTAKLVSNFEGVEYFQYSPVVDHLHILWRTGVLGFEDAASYLQLNIDSLVYDRAIGRGLNLRVEDSSCVLKAYDFGNIARRAFEPGGEAVIADYSGGRRLPVFMTHEAFPQVELFFGAMPSSKVIEVVRHPVDVVASWIRRGWGHRFGTDPLAFVPTVSCNGQPVPWWAQQWGEEYLAATPDDRTALSLLAYGEMVAATRTRLPAHFNDRILFLSYEGLFGDTDGSLQAIARFTDRRPHASIEMVKVREGVPAVLDPSERRAKFEAQRRVLSSRVFERLVGACRSYEEEWGVEPV